MTRSPPPRKAFEEGRLVLMPDVSARVGVIEILSALQRHLCGDWGECDERQAQANDEALLNDLAVLSVHRDEGGTEFWIFTEGDRSKTVVTLP